jgi:hypothetical protein
MSTKTFPPVVFVSVENYATEDEYLAVNPTKSEALGNDDRKIVGMYKFIEAHEITKALPITKKRRTIKTA